MRMTPRVIVKKLIRRWSISSSARCCDRHALLMISWFTTMSQKNVSDNGSDWCSDTTRRRSCERVHRCPGSVSAPRLLLGVGAPSVLYCCLGGEWSNLPRVCAGSGCFPTTPACTWWNRPEEDHSSGKLELTHPSRTSVK